VRARRSGLAGILGRILGDRLGGIRWRLRRGQVGNSAASTIGVIDAVRPNGRGVRRNSLALLDPHFCFTCRDSPGDRPSGFPVSGTMRGYSQGEIRRTPVSTSEKSPLFELPRPDPGASCRAPAPPVSGGEHPGGSFISRARAAVLDDDDPLIHAARTIGESPIESPSRVRTRRRG